MGQTNPNYTVFEIAISCEYGGVHTNGLKERKTVGDIIAVRRPNTAIGRLEMSGYIWLRVEGLEENEMARLKDPIDGHDKRRYCIPLDRLLAIAPAFNISRAKDLNDKYQPFLGVDEEPPYRFIYGHRPLNVHGLIFDKQTGRYI